MATIINNQKAGKISIAAIDSGKLSDIDKMIISIQVSYTMNMASELRFTVIDPDFSMMSKNYFQVGRTVIYTTQTLGTINEFATPNAGQKIVENVDQLFEISRIDVSQGPGQSPQVAVTCYSKAVQQMKRDKNPKAIKQEGTAFVREAARTYGLKFVGERTSKTKKINSAKGDKQAESLWQVIESLATDSKFVVFETNATLVFSSQKYLLNKWGIKSDTVQRWDKKKKRLVPKTEKYIPLVYPSVPTIGQDGQVINPVFEILNIPSLEYSENDPYDGRGSLQLSRTNATQLRPGMTIDIQGIPQFNGRYLIESVSFDDLSPDPVSISFRKPQKEEKDIKQLKVGKKYAQSNQFSQKDKTQTGPFGLLSSRTKKFIPEYSRLLGLAYGTTMPSQKPPGKINPIPDAYNELRYPQKPTKPTGILLELGNIDLWSRPVYRDESGIYPLDIQIAVIDSATNISPVAPTWYTGNIDLFKRPIVTNEDGSISTVLSMSFLDSRINKEVLIPKVILKDGEGIIVSDNEAIKYYYATNEHLGKFNTPAEAEYAAELIHDQQEAFYSYVGLQYLLLPAIYIDAMGVPQRVEDADEALTRYTNDGLHLGKFSNYGLALMYKKLLDIQQVYILSQRFPPPLFDIPEHSLYPLPTNSQQQNYPHMGSGLIESGNIDLYSRPLLTEKFAGKNRQFTSRQYVKWSVTEPGYNLDQPFALLLEMVWNINGRDQQLTPEEAYRKYKQDGLFLAKCNSYIDAGMYAQLIHQQQLLISKTRFPGVRLADWTIYG